MRLLSLHLKNIGPFSKYTVDFKGNLIGIVGPNGAGKSTLVEALYSGLTGDFRKFPTIGAFLRDLPNGKKASSGTLKVTLAVNETELTIKRLFGFEPSGRTKQTVRSILRVPGTDPQDLRGSKILHQTLLDLIGEDYKLLGLYSFISQGKISSIVEVAEAERVKLIHELLRLTRFEAIWSILGEESRNIPELELVEDRETVLNDLKVKQEELKAVEAEIQKIENKYEELAVDRLNDLLEKWNSVKSLESELLVLSSVSQEINSSKSSTQSKLSKLDNELANISVEKLKEDRATVLQKLNILLEREQRQSRLGELDKRAKDLAAKISRLTKPQPPKDKWTEKEQKELDSLKHELQTIDEFLSKCSDNKSARCPTCNQVIKNLAEELAKRKRRKAVLEKQIAKKQLRCDQLKKALADYERELSIYESKMQDLVIDCKEVAAEAEALKEKLDSMPLVEESKEELQKLIRDFDVQEARIEDIKKQQNELKISLKEASERLKENEKKKKIILKKIKDLEPALLDLTPEKIEEYKKKINKGSDLKVQLARLKTTRDNILTVIRDHKCRLERITSLEKKRQIYKDVKQDLLDAREIFHRTNLPMRLAEAYISKIDAQMNDFLELMGAPFSVSLSLGKGYNFTCIFSDGTQRDARFLSGGEKVKFSIAFYLAVHSLLAGRVGVLSLDEPTAQLDEESISNLVETLHKVRGYARNSGLQIFMITHSPQLHSCFDQTIHLTKSLFGEQ